jgi:twitching motility protein PilT
MEVMITTPAIRALVREGKSHQIYSQIQTGGRQGMRTMAQALCDLVKSGRVRVDEAERALSDPAELRGLLRGGAAA